MSPIQSHKGKLVVRHSSMAPSPYLKSLSPFLKDIRSFCLSHNKMATAVDVGCGNGRNSTALMGMGYEVISFDRQPDYGYPIELGEKEMPIFNGSANIVLLQYILMFLKDDGSGTAPIYRVIQQAFDMCGYPGAIVVELCPVKNSLYSAAELDKIQADIIKMAHGCGWREYRAKRFHFTVTNRFSPDPS